MAKNFGRVNVSITASTGGLTAGLGRASKQLRGFQAQAGGVGGMLRNSLAGFVGLGRGATMAAIGVRALAMAVKTLLLPLAAIMSVVGIFRALGRAARDLDAASKAARRLGMAVSTFQTLSQVAEEAGVDVGQMTNLLTFMTRNLGNLANGSRAAQAAFGRIGLTFADLQNLSPERQFELISQRIMALPTVAERTAAAVAIFGRAGAQAMGLIEAASSGAVAEVEALRKQLGMDLTGPQAKGIEMMNDAIGRMSMVFQGFINQFLAELAPAITTVANLFVKFFAENTKGWSTAKSLAFLFASQLRFLVGYWTVLYGIGQLVFSMYAKGFSLIMPLVSKLLDKLQGLTAFLAEAAEAVGLQTLAENLRAASGNMGHMANVTAAAAEMAASDAATAWANGWENITNPFAAFDAEFASVTAQMEEAGVVAGTAFGETAGKSIAASTKDLKAIVVGTSEGEAFRNSIMRGADPRLEGDAARETADNTERTADAVEDLAGELAGVGGLGLATISV